MSAGAPRIVIAGGGAGGLELAIALAHQARRHRGMAEIILLDRFATHFWKPRLHELAAGAAQPEGATAEYAALSARHGFRFVPGRMDRLDAPARRLCLEDAPALDYDYLVLALGSVVNDFGTPGVAEYCDMLDDVPQAARLHQRIAAGMRRMADDKTARLGIAIIGAGATGVELAAEIRAQTLRHPAYRAVLEAGRLRITIIDMADRVLPGGPPDLSQAVAQRLHEQGIELILGQRVVKVTDDALRLADGRVIEAAVKVWASGVKAPDWLKQCPALDLAPDNRIKVDASLRCLGHQSVFAFGDCAAFTAIGAAKPLPPTAQAAHQQSRFLARALPRLLRGAPMGAFHYRDFGMLVSLGQRHVVGETGAPAQFRLRGIIARLLYIGLYEAHLAALYGWPETAAMAGERLAHRTPSIALKLHNINPSG